MEWLSTRRPSTISSKSCSLWLKELKTSKTKSSAILHQSTNSTKQPKRPLSNSTSKRKASATFISKYRKSTPFWNSCKISTIATTETCLMRSISSRKNMKSYWSSSILLKMSIKVKAIPAISMVLTTVAQTETSTKFPRTEGSESEANLLM